MSIFSKIKDTLKNAFKKADANLDEFGDKVRGREVTTATRTHVVEQGDTLSAISLRYYGTANKYNRIYDANRSILKDPDEIYPGQVLTIPAAE